MAQCCLLLFPSCGRYNFVFIRTSGKTDFCDRCQRLINWELLPMLLLMLLLLLLLLLQRQHNNLFGPVALQCHSHFINYSQQFTPSSSLRLQCCSLFSLPSVFCSLPFHSMVFYSVPFSLSVFYSLTFSFSFFYSLTFSFSFFYSHPFLIPFQFLLCSPSR